MNYKNWKMFKIKKEYYSGFLGGIREIQTWVNDNVKYKSEKGDYWQTAMETLQKKEGDCEDKAILMISILLYQNEDPGKMIILSRQKKEGSKERDYHAALYYYGNIYDSTSADLIILNPLGWKKEMILPLWAIPINRIWRRMWFSIKGK